MGHYDDQENRSKKYNEMEEYFKKMMELGNKEVREGKHDNHTQLDDKWNQYAMKVVEEKQIRLYNYTNKRWTMSKSSENYGVATVVFDECTVDYPGLTIPPEMYDFIKVLQHSANNGKYPADNWLEPNGHSTDKKSMFASIFRHVACAYSDSLHSPTMGSPDFETRLDHRLHAAARLLMDYVRVKKGLINDKDK